MKRIIVKFYFDTEIRVIGFILGFYSWLIGLLNESWLLFVLSLILSYLLFYTHYEVTLDRYCKYYMRALFLLGFRFGKKVPFEQMEYCEIVKGNYTDLFMLGPFGIDSSGEMYHAFIHFSNGDSVQIGKNKDRTKLLAKINFFRFDYGVNIIERDDLAEVYSDRLTKLKKSVSKSRMGKDLLITGLITLVFASIGYWYNQERTYMIWLMLVSIVVIIVGSIRILRLKVKN